MREVIKSMALTGILLFSNYTFATNYNPAIISATNEFQFQISDYKTQRQGGQRLTVYVRYALKDNLDKSEYPDYIPMRKVVLNYLEPTNELPENEYWEVVVQHIADDLYQNYPIKGISIQALVYPSKPGSIWEPGFHGPIYSRGQINSLGVVPQLKSL